MEVKCPLPGGLDHGAWAALCSQFTSREGSHTPRGVGVGPRGRLPPQEGHAHSHRPRHGELRSQPPLPGSTQPTPGEPWARPKLIPNLEMGEARRTPEGTSSEGNVGRPRLVVLD